VSSALVGPKPTRLRATPGIQSLTLSWRAHGGAGLLRWRVHWRRLTVRAPRWSAIVQLPTQARSYKITGLVPGIYEVRVWPVLAGAKLGGLARVRAKPLAGTPRKPAGLARQQPPGGSQAPRAREASPPGRTFYVSPTGSDRNAGTSIALAWRTLGKVNSATLKAGDTVLFQGGAVFADTYLAGNAGGEPGRPITYASYGVGKANIQKGVWDASHSFLVYDNLLVAGASVSSGDGFGGRGSDVTVENSTVTNVSEGIGVVTGDRWHILNDVVENTGDSGILTQTGDNGGHPGDGWVIDGNIIANTGRVNLGYGEHGIYLKCRDSEVAHNVITNFPAEGVSQRYGNATIVGNRISGGNIGIGFIPYDNQPHTSLWADNEVSETNTGLFAPATDSGSPPPGGTTLESFILSGNVIGPLKGGSHAWIDVHTRGTVSEPGGNTFR
jgi:Periplasmic copper-binding protein (NosD)